MPRKPRKPAHTYVDYRGTVPTRLLSSESVERARLNYATAAINANTPEAYRYWSRKLFTLV